MNNINKDCRDAVFIFCYIWRMKTKLHFGILIILMTFLGRYIETPVVPNQQIVIEFSDSEITENETQKTIDAIQSKLQLIGVSDIQVRQDEEGHLKITYYSKADVAQIEDVLSSAQGLKLTHNSNKENSSGLPKEKSLKDYEINISEIQSSNDTNWDFEDVYVLELNHKSDRFNKVKDNNSSVKFNLELLNDLTKVKVKTINNIAMAIDSPFYKIPDVRAGPTV